MTYEQQFRCDGSAQEVFEDSFPYFTHAHKTKQTSIPIPGASMLVDSFETSGIRVEGNSLFVSRTNYLSYANAVAQIGGGRANVAFTYGAHVHALLGFVVMAFLLASIDGLVQYITAQGVVDFLRTGAILLLSAIVLLGGAVISAHIYGTRFEEDVIHYFKAREASARHREKMQANRR